MAFFMASGPGHTLPQTVPPSFELTLDSWEVAQPQDLRFGVVTQNSQGQTYLSRLRTQMPVALPPDPALPYGAFSRAPSEARVHEVNGVLEAHMVQADRPQQKSGYAGLWWQLEPLASTAFSGERSTPNYLSFWVKARGTYRLKLADARWLQKEDAQTLGVLSDFYAPPRADTAGWRQVIVPLSDLSAFSLDPSQLKQVVIQAEPTVPGVRSLQLRNLTLTAALPSPSPPFQVLPEVSAPDRVPRGYATWVWHTDELLQHPERWSAFAQALRGQHIEQVYLQWPGDSAEQQRLAQLVEGFQSQGIGVHALAGDPRWALQPHHPEALAVLEAVIQYQKQYPQAAFVGLHYDIEPYLLPGFFGRRQPHYLRDHVHLAQQLYGRARAEGLLLSYALPYWLDAPDEFTGQRLRVQWQGQSRAFHEWLQLFSDAIALMDYKTVVTGPQGIVASADRELAFARAQGKKVWIALETMALPDEQLFTFTGPPLRRRPEGTVLGIYPQGRGWRFAVLSPNQTLPEGVLKPLYWPLKAYAQVDAAQLSFAQKGAEALTQVLQATENTLGQDPAFGGMAVHHSESFLALMTLQKP